MRFRRLGILITAVLLTLSAALVVQERQAHRREAILLARLAIVEKERIISELAVQELDAIRQEEFARLRARIAETMKNATVPKGVESHDAK